tara:strand:+ start:561 stop:788 length:228 start_codon:yes stop_codon:yes gene_type:complete
MLKTLKNIDEIEEAHKLDGLSSNFNKISLEKDAENKKNKMIDPKFIFEKRPKKTKEKISYRKPNNNEKMPLIKEY